MFLMCCNSDQNKFLKIVIVGPYIVVYIHSVPVDFVLSIIVIKN
jgi:hypothetical protein